MLEQFVICGVNLSLFELCLIGDEFGWYCFVVDFDGYVFDECVVDVFFGLKWFSLNVLFFGLYLCVDKFVIEVILCYGDEVFIDVCDWFCGLILGVLEQQDWVFL